MCARVVAGSWVTSRLLSWDDGDTASQRAPDDWFKIGDIEREFSAESVKMTVWLLLPSLSPPPLSERCSKRWHPRRRRRRRRRRNVSIIRLAFFSPNHFSRSNGSTNSRPVLPRRHDIKLTSSRRIFRLSLSQRTSKVSRFRHLSRWPLLVCTSYSGYLSFSKFQAKWKGNLFPLEPTGSWPIDAGKMNKAKLDGEASNTTHESGWQVGAFHRHKKKT